MCIRDRTSNTKVFEAHERLLLELASKFLERRVCLVPLFAEDTHVETFEPPEPGSSRTYYLLGCNKTFTQNFFVSIVPNEPEVKSQKVLKLLHLLLLQWMVFQVFDPFNFSE